MSSVGTPHQVEQTSLDLPSTSTPDDDLILRNARSASPSRSDGFRTPTSRTDSSGYISRLSIQDEFRSQDLTPVKMPDQLLIKQEQLPEGALVGVKQEANENVEQETKCGSSESAGFEWWRDNYELLNTWLEMKEKDLMTFGSTPLEPQMVIGQVQQLWVHCDDFNTRKLRLRRLTSALAKLPEADDDAQKLEQLEQRWWRQLRSLEAHGKRLGDACLERLRNALQEVSNGLDKLPLDDDSDEQLLRKIELLSEQLKTQQALLACGGNVVEQLGQTLGNPAFSSDLKVEFRSVKNIYNNLQKNISDKKAEIERSLSDCRQFDDVCKDTLVWLDTELDGMSEKLLVSANRMILHQQSRYYKVVYQRVIGGEPEVMSLLKRGHNALSRPQNRGNTTQQRYLDMMESRWNRLKKQNLGIHDKLKTCTERCGKFYQAHDLFVIWLSKVEQKFKSLKPASLNDVEKVLKEMTLFSREIGEKSNEFEQCSNLGNLFIDACDEDIEVVKSELISMNNRWDKINNDLLERTQSLKQTEKHLAEFNKSMCDLNHRLQLREDELVSYVALELATKDSNRLDCIKEVEDETAFLQGSLDSLSQHASDLVSQADEQGIDDASPLLETVNRLDIRIKNLTDMLANDIFEKVVIIGEINNENLTESDINTTIERPSVEIVTLDSSDEGEFDATDVAPKQQRCESLLQQSDKIEQHPQSYDIKLDDASRNSKQSLKVHKLERKSEEMSVEETRKDPFSGFGGCNNEKSRNSKNKRKKHRRDSNLSPLHDIGRKKCRNNTRSEKKHYSDSELEDSVRTKKNNETLSSSRISLSKDPYSSSPRTENKCDKPRPNINFSPSTPRKLKYFNKSDDDYSDREFRLPRIDWSNQDTFHFRNSKTNDGSDRNPSRSSSQERCWRKQHFDRRSNSRQGYCSNRFQYYARNERSRSLSSLHHDPRFGRNNSESSSRSTRINQTYYPSPNQPFRNASRQSRGHGSMTSVQYWKQNTAEESGRQKEQDHMSDKYAKSSERSKPGQNQNPTKRDSHEIGKPD